MMKRYRCAALAAALLPPGLRAVGARAQENVSPPHRAERQDGIGRGAVTMVERIKAQLVMNDEQTVKFKDAVKAHDDTMNPLARRMKDGDKKLAEQIKTKAPDADIQASLDGIKSARKAIFDEQERFQEGLAAFLSPLQRAKMIVGMEVMMRSKAAEYGWKGWRGPPGDAQDGGDAPARSAASPRPGAGKN